MAVEKISDDDISNYVEKQNSQLLTIEAVSFLSQLSDGFEDELLSRKKSPDRFIMLDENTVGDRGSFIRQLNSYELENESGQVLDENGISKEKLELLKGKTIIESENDYDFIDDEKDDANINSDSEKQFLIDEDSENLKSENKNHSEYNEETSTEYGTKFESEEYADAEDVEVEEVEEEDEEEISESEEIELEEFKEEEEEINAEEDAEINEYETNKDTNTEELEVEEILEDADAEEVEIEEEVDVEDYKTDVDVSVNKIGSEENIDTEELSEDEDKNQIGDLSNGKNTIVNCSTKDEYNTYHKIVEFPTEEEVENLENESFGEGRGEAQKLILNNKFDVDQAEKHLDKKDGKTSNVNNNNNPSLKNSNVDNVSSNFKFLGEVDFSGIDFSAVDIKDRVASAYIKRTVYELAGIGKLESSKWKHLSIASKSTLEKFKEMPSVEEFRKVQIAFGKTDINEVIADYQKLVSRFINGGEAVLQKSIEDLKKELKSSQNLSKKN